MKVVCKEETAKNIDLNEVRDISSNEFEYPVEEGDEYIVMGIMVRKDSNYVFYLIDNFNFPRWLPYELFDVVDSELPPYWYIKILDKEKSTGTVFYRYGFNELCNYNSYHDDLMNCEKYALDIYFKRKAEVEEWYEEKALIAWAKKQS